MTWLRKIIENIISENPQTGKVDDLGGVQESQLLDDKDDCLTTFRNRRKVTKSCGCFAEEAGRCSEEGCGAVVCVNCYKHCGGTNPQHSQGCGVSLCRRHSHYFEFPEGTVVPFCKNCFGKLRRRQGWTKVGKFLFEPLDSFGGEGCE